MLPISGPITPHSLVVGQAWSTVFELYFYSLFAILLLIKLPRRYIVHGIVTLYIVGYGYRFALLLFTSNIPWVYRYVLVYAISVLLFSVQYRVYRHWKDKYPVVRYLIG